VSWVITIILNYLFDVPFYQLEIKFVFSDSLKRLPTIFKNRYYKGIKETNAPCQEWALVEKKSDSE